MTALKVLFFLLKLAAWAARQADQRATEKALANELEILQGKRVRAAVAAYDDVMSGRVRVDERTDPNARRP